MVLLKLKENVFIKARRDCIAMKLLNFLKEHREIISISIIVIFTGGIYYNKINNIEHSVESSYKDISSATNDIHKLNAKMAVLIAVLQKDYPNINVSMYMKNTIDNATPPMVIASGLNILKNKDSQQGSVYLQQHMGFNADQISSVYELPKN